MTPMSPLAFRHIPVPDARGPVLGHLLARIGASLGPLPCGDGAHRLTRHVISDGEAGALRLARAIGAGQVPDLYPCRASAEAALAHYPRGLRPGFAVWSVDAGALPGLLS